METPMPQAPAEERKLHPSQNDPLEQRIRKLIREHVYSSNLGRESFTQVNNLQIDYFQTSLSQLDDPTKIYQSTQKLVQEIAKTTRSHIVEGEEILERVPKRKPVFVAVNHFSGYKLISIPPQKVGLTETEMAETGKGTTEEIYPFPVFYAPLSPVAKQLECDLIDAHLEMPGKHLRQLQEAAGLLVVPAERGQFQLIEQRTKDLFIKRPNSLMVLFPEGETSGKRNNGGPFDTVGFHSGLWRIATDLAKEDLIIPIITAYQYWSPNFGFEIGIVDVTIPDPSLEKDPEQLALVSRGKMQAALDKRKK
jgi:hypothetical protein